MFRTLARLIHDPASGPNTVEADATNVFLIHPVQLSRWLEQVWFFGGQSQIAWGSLTGLSRDFLGSTDIVGALTMPIQLRDTQLASGISATNNPFPTVPPPEPPIPFSPPPPPGAGLPAGLPWEHLMYALLIEQTGVLEICAEVVRRYVVGETLEVPTIETEHWLRATEELFFRDPPLFNIAGITSSLRPDLRISRRNAYWRLFGMDLAHPLPPGHGAPAGSEPPWKRDVGIFNSRFRSVLVEFLREVWIGIENLKNLVGAKPTDDAYIAELARLLSDMLGMRRRGGQLAREEFVHVTWLSWFHLTLEYNTPLIRDLKAEGPESDPADRLIKLGQRVGITAPPHAREYFELADLMSPLLRFIELGAFNDPSAAVLLYDVSGQIGRDANRIIDLWQMATGDRLKDTAVRTAPSPSGAHTGGRVPIGAGLASVGATPAPTGSNGAGRG
jgi:hypothetical protein